MTETLTGLKAIQREAKKATQAIRELETMYGTDEGRFYVKWNQDEEDNCTNIQTTKLSDIPTKYLQRELSKREELDTNMSKADKLLEKSIKNGILVTDLNENIRGIGKTTALIKKAYELDIPIIVGNSMTMQNIIEYSGIINLDIKCYNGNHIEGLRGKRFANNSFLVDDTATNKMIIELQNYGFKCIGGFNSLRASIS